MSLFGKILTKLGLRKEEDKASSRTSTQARAKEFADKAKEYSKKPQAVSEVDVVSKLEAMAAKNPQDLNWRTSIVDLLKLLDIDSSYEARKEMAVELGCPPDKMDDSAAMNTWLHQTVLKKIAENGGNIPQSLLN
ncbi:MAG: DUF3597 domain-containing protein [Anaerolineales bacterium]